MEKFNIEKFVDEIELKETAEDMHLSVYYDPEAHDYDNYLERNKYETD
jgi:hypothetical protein